MNTKKTMDNVIEPRMKMVIDLEEGEKSDHSRSARNSPVRDDELSIESEVREADRPSQPSVKSLHDYEDEGSASGESASNDEEESSSREAGDEPLWIEFTKKKTFDDIEIMVNGKSFFANMAILSQWTHYFVQNAKKRGSNYRIGLFDLLEEQVGEFLVKTSPPCALKVDANSVKRFLDLAHKLGVPLLAQECFATLKGMDKSLEVAYLLDKYSDSKLSTEVENLLDGMIPWLADHYTEICNDWQFKAMSKDSILAVVNLYRRDTVLEDPRPAKKMRLFGFFSW